MKKSNIYSVDETRYEVWGDLEFLRKFNTKDDAQVFARSIFEDRIYGYVAILEVRLTQAEVLQ